MSEIDIKIAGIMGCVYDIQQIDGWDRKGGFLIVDGSVQRYRNLSMEEWRPSVRLDHALEVVHRMREDAFSFKAWQPSKTPYNEGDPPVEIAVVSFICSTGPCPRHGTTHHNHHGAYDIEGETLPMAICKAALIALKK